MRQIKISKQITRRDSDSIDKYLNEISRLEQITPQEEMELGRRIRETGDEGAVDKLVKANLRFVVSVAKQYQNSGLSLADLINEGNIGLIKAAKKFDETRGFKFISYAVWWIRQSIMAAISAKTRTVKIPGNKVLEMNKIYQAIQEFEQKEGREPTSDELAEKLEIPESEVDLIQATFKHAVSLNAPTRADEDRSLMDTMPDTQSKRSDELLDNESRMHDIESFMTMLNERERKVVAYHFGINQYRAYSYPEIGELLGTTPERARQIKNNALKKLQKSKKRELLKHYLG